MLIKWWKKWFRPKHAVKAFCYFCHIELTETDETARGLVKKENKPPREVLAHKECMYEDDIFTKLSHGDPKQ